MPDGTRVLVTAPTPSTPPLPVGLELRYRCDANALGSHADRFRALEIDEATSEYLERAEHHRHGALKTALHGVFTSFASDFDVNGVLDMYRMHLLSTDQFRTLLGPRATGTWLDIGAGSGDVTAQGAPLFDSVVTTEVSWAMSRRLRRRGFSCHRVDVTENEIPGGPYNVVSCLNVLDRCWRPITLITRALDALADNGRLLLALALPYRPWVYDGPATEDPLEAFDCVGGTWEQMTAHLAQVTLPKCGLEVETISRAPYLSSGDTQRPLYVLDDAVFVCRRK